MHRSDPELADLRSRVTVVVGADGEATQVTFDDLDADGTGTLARV